MVAWGASSTQGPLTKSRPSEGRGRGGGRPLRENVHEVVASLEPWETQWGSSLAPSVQMGARPERAVQAKDLGDDSFGTRPLGTQEAEQGGISLAELSLCLRLAQGQGLRVGWRQ